MQQNYIWKFYWILSKEFILPNDNYLEILLLLLYEKILRPLSFSLIFIWLDCLSCTPWAPKISKMLQLSKLLQLFEDEFWSCSSLLGPQKSIYPVTAQTCSVDPYTLRVNIIRKFWKLQNKVIEKNMDRNRNIQYKIR